MMKSDAEKLLEVEDLFSFVMKVQDKLAPRVASPREMEVGEKRKGVLMIRGGNKWTKILEVRAGRLVPCDSLDNVRTMVVFEGIDAFRGACQELLAGNSMAFSRARARGTVKVVGDYALRDAATFNRLLTKVGKILRSYNVRLGDE